MYWLLHVYYIVLSNSLSTCIYRMCMSFIPSFIYIAHIFFKLVNGPNGDSLNEGRVQIYAYANIINRWDWHDVCADEWDLSDADAVCLNLGYPYAVVASKGSQYGTHINGTTWEFDLHCGATDIIPSECSFSNSTTCSQGTAGILCSTG